MQNSEFNILEVFGRGYAYNITSRRVSERPQASSTEGAFLVTFLDCRVLLKDKGMYNSLAFALQFAADHFGFAVYETYDICRVDCDFSAVHHHVYACLELAPENVRVC